ncbi:MAG: AbrB family transcriptional regulator [Synergistaceae bacterium]|jgi:membrane AbrB-like protein|nr:AbrB family transcriptional regulator [Synergistaceae bacterium]
MHQISGFFFSFLVGSAGYLLFSKLKIPSPALLGSMFACGLVGMAGHLPEFPVWAVSFASNTLIGIMLGRLIGRDVFGQILKLLRPVLSLSVAMLSLSLASGFALYALSGLDLHTSLISGAAGGIAEMIIYGISVDADVSVIAFIQTFRIVTFLMLIPYFAKIAEKIGGRQGQAKPARGEERAMPPFGLGEYAALVLVSLIGAIAGKLLGIPTGALIGAMVASGAYATAIGKSYRYDTRIRCFAQIALGMVTGERLTPDTVSALGNLLMPALAVTGVMIAGSALFAFLLYKHTDWDLVTCLLCAAPAGISQISVYAEEIGADTFTASVFHAVRIISIVTLYPLVTMLF